MKKVLLILMLALTSTLISAAGTAMVTFKLDNRDKGTLYLNGKKAGEIRGGKLDKALKEGKYKLEVKTDEYEGSYWYYTDKIELFDGDMKTIIIGDMELKFTEEYYIGNFDYKEYLNKYPNGKYAKMAKEQIKNFVKEAKPIIENIKSNLVFVHGGENGDFYIGKYEVTQDEFKALMSFNPSRYKENKAAVEEITWYDAVIFCNQLSIKDGFEPYYEISKEYKVGSNITYAKIDILGGKGYRLPTSSEWEYAARGGEESKGYKYSGSNNIDEVAWHGYNANKTTHKVGMKKPNEIGIFDMTGNVEEWCWDIVKYSNGYSGRIYRGGAYDNITEYCELSKAPESNGAGQKINSIGLRIVRTK